MPFDKKDKEKRKKRRAKDFSNLPESSSIATPFDIYNLAKY